jgi:SAM-dependent methyltransferase
MFLKRLERHNFTSLLRLIPINITHYAGYYSFSRIRARRTESEFDRKFGVDTAKSIPVGALGGNQSFSRHASPYAAIDATLLRSTLASLPIDDFSRFLFVDYGSGKGKALLIAADFGFREIIGIEFSTHLHQIARANVSKIQMLSNTSPTFTLVNADVAQYSPPAGAMLAFFNNPFDEFVMSKVLDTLEDPITIPELLLIYANPRNRRLLEARGWITVVDKGSVVVFQRSYAKIVVSARSAVVA